jgi:hypothetical protein
MPPENIAFSMMHSANTRPIQLRYKVGEQPGEKLQRYPDDLPPIFGRSTTKTNEDQLTRAQCRRSPETTSRYWLP